MPNVERPTFNGVDLARRGRYEIKPLRVAECRRRTTLSRVHGQFLALQDHRCGEHVFAALRSSAFRSETHARTVRLGAERSLLWRGQRGDGAQDRQSVE